MTKIVHSQQQKTHLVIQVLKIPRVTTPTPPSPPNKKINIFLDSGLVIFKVCRDLGKISKTLSQFDLPSNFTQYKLKLGVQ